MSIGLSLLASDFTPTDEQRKQVKVHRFNGLGEHRIAALLGITHAELVYHFADELEYGTDEILEAAAERMIWLAHQTEDKGVAFRANKYILETRLKEWRIPKDNEADQGRKAISKMSLAEVEEELARLDERRGEAVRTPGEEG